MVKTIEELEAGAAVIKNETTPNANTATRVGQMLVDMIDTLRSLAIPINGTEEDKPVTGDVEVNNAGGKQIFSYTRDDDFELDGGFSQLNVNNQSSSIAFVNVGNSITRGFYASRNNLSVGDTDPGSRGITSAQDFTPNITDLDYVQYKLLPKVANNFPDDIEAATGGIAVGAMYHTDGVVKIRLA